MEFSRQEYWLPFPSPGDLSDPGIEPVSPALAGEFLTIKLPGKTLIYLNLRNYFLPFNKQVFHGPGTEQGGE